uniref:BTB domain-containing protein n=1 Tax=Arcella intermedia TaxID=1963864 RepID=A0A6B2LLX0_9EUKA
MRARGENYFTSLISGRLPTTMDQEGAYFVDRDPTCFGIMLNYLRTGEVVLPPQFSLRLLQIEAAFYCINLPSEYSPTKTFKYQQQCCLLHYEEDSTGNQTMSLLGDTEETLSREFGQRKSCDWKNWVINLQHRGWELTTSNLFIKRDSEERLFMFRKSKG